MNRRDFLSLRTVREPEPTFDLECHALYMQWVDVSGRGVGRVPDADFDPMSGEPPASFETLSADDLLQRLEQRLASVTRLRVLDGEWLQTTGLGDRVTPMLDAFRARGGTIVFDSTASY